MIPYKKITRQALVAVLILDATLTSLVMCYSIPVTENTPPKKNYYLKVVLAQKPIQPTDDAPPSEPHSKLERFIENHQRRLESSLASNRDPEVRSAKKFTSLKEVPAIDDDVDLFDPRASKYNRTIRFKKKPAPQKTEDKEALYFSGNSHINYLLKNRYTRHIPSPLYRCPGSGLVVVNVWVNARGAVEKAEINELKSTADECLITVAIQSAIATKFNPNHAANQLQKGYISYHF